MCTKVRGVGRRLRVSRVKVSGRRSRSRLAVVMFESFGGQSEVDHSSHCLRISPAILAYSKAVREHEHTD